MNTKEAIEFLENGVDLSTTELEKEYLKKMDGVISLLQTQQELVTKFSKEGDEYQKNLDQIDLWAMEIQERIKKIRGKI